MIPYYRPYYSRLEVFAALHPGPKRATFEAAFARAMGARYGMAFAYGRSALFAALEALGVSDAEVVLPAYTCQVVAQAIVAAGNRLAFVDISLSDFNMDVSALHRALSPATRAVVATHMFGYPTDLGAIRDALGDDRILLIEDCAQSLPVSPLGTQGTRGDLRLFSFGPNKPLSTLRGGMIVTDSPHIHEAVRRFRDQEMDQTSARTYARHWARLLGSYLVLNERTYGLWYRHRDALAPSDRQGTTPPSESLPTDHRTAYTALQARLGLVQLRKASDIIARRRALFALYDGKLRDIPGVHTPPLVDGASCTHYTLRIPDGGRTAFREHMAAHGVATDQSYDYALPYLDQYRAFAREECPYALQASQEVVNLPCYPDLRHAQALHIARCARAWAAR